MKKRMIWVLLLAMVVVCLSACTANETKDMPGQPDQTQLDETEQEKTDTNGTNDTIQSDDASDGVNQSQADDTADDANDSIQSGDQDNDTTEDSHERIQSVFKTENIAHISFYGYFGGGEGVEVPALHMTDITNWLKSFTVGDVTPQILPPGTNTIHVEIEYADGTVIKRGIDTITVDDTTYYTKYGNAPECYQEILSQLG